MSMEFTSEQEKIQAAAAAFVDSHIVPFADQYDAEQKTPHELILKLGQAGYLGAFVPDDFCGNGMSMLDFGIVLEEIGRGSASILSLFAVHGMLCQAVIQWGSVWQRETYLPKLAQGKLIGAFGLSEPNFGSDARGVQTRAENENDYFVLNGEKKWISFGQIADLFLIIARCDDQPTAFLVERNTPGLTIKPIFNMLGFRAAMLAELHFENCRIPAVNIVGRIGTGFSLVANMSLNYGRYCIASGCVGLAQACITASLDYCRKRVQGGVLIKEHQLIRSMVADMITRLKAARLLCRNAGKLMDDGDPESIMETAIAKYFAATSAAQTANSAVQIHGAMGCSPELPIQRYFRDARIMEIIEGSNQIQQLIISDHGFRIY